MAKKVKKVTAIDPAEKARIKAETMSKKAAAKAEKAKARETVKAEKAKAMETVKAEKAAASAEAKARAEHDKARAVAKLTKTLAPVAREINERIEKAAGLDGKADDHRLAAALRLEEARKACEAGKVDFKAWCTANVTQGYEAIRKLVKIGAAPDPKLALADMRAGNKAANKKHRDTKKVGSRDTKLIGADPKKVVQTGLNAMKPAEQLAAITERATALGMKIVSATPPGPIAPVAPVKPENKTPENEIAELKALFENLVATAKMTFLNWAVAEVGGTLTLPDFSVKSMNSGDLSADDAPEEDTLGPFRKAKKSA